MIRFTLLFPLFACDGTTIKLDDSATTGEDDSGEPFVPTGPDWALGEEEPEGAGLASCAWALFEAAREQFSGDAELVSLAGTGDLVGNVESCQGLFTSRSKAGRVASIFYDSRGPVIGEEDLPDLPLCTYGSVSYSTVVETPISEWYADSVVLDAAFADVESSTQVTIHVVPPVVMPDINLCTGGDYHFSFPTEDLESVMVGVAFDCGEAGVYCAVAIDPRTGATLERL